MSVRLEREPAVRVSATYLRLKRRLDPLNRSGLGYVAGDFIGLPFRFGVPYRSGLSNLDAIEETCTQRWSTRTVHWIHPPSSQTRNRSQ